MHVPKVWVEEVEARVKAGCEFLDAAREVLAVNAELLTLARQPRLPKPWPRSFRGGCGTTPRDNCV